MPGELVLGQPVVAQTESTGAMRRTTQRIAWHQTVTPRVWLGCATLADMAELWLSRSLYDRNRFDLEGIGVMLRPHWWDYRGRAETVDGQRWTFRTRGVTGCELEATDAEGRSVGRYEQGAGPDLSSPLDWDSRPFRAKAVGEQAEVFSLQGGGRELLRIDVGEWKNHPAHLMFTDPPRNGALPPGLVMFAIWVAHVVTRRIHNEARH